VISSSLASAVGMSDSPPHSRFSCVNQSPGYHSIPGSAQRAGVSRRRFGSGAWGCPWKPSHTWLWVLCLSNTSSMYTCRHNGHHNKLV